jgi:spermidine/putrescine transport system substrate-binding protein
VLVFEGTSKTIPKKDIVALYNNKTEIIDVALAYERYLYKIPIDYISQSWVIENILYKVPNKAAMDLVAAKLGETYPNMLMTPAELLKGEGLIDLGAAGPMYTKIATEITASK